MKIPIYQVDAFTGRVFGGNPAAVCPLDAWLPDATLQSIAAENNLSETAYLVERGDDYELRWFTPAIEVDLCGHATLASAWVVFERLRKGASSVRFHSKSGELGVERRGGWLEMDFPSQPGEPFDAPAGLIDALGGAPLEVLRSVHFDLVVFGTEAEVVALEPSERGLLEHEQMAVIATAPGDDEGVDFVSRVFAPRAGVYEDPVTGSAHCVSVPYWAERLGRGALKARQVSKRVGEIDCELRGDRVVMAGEAVMYLEGVITV